MNSVILNLQQQEKAAIKVRNDLKYNADKESDLLEYNFESAERNLEKIQTALRKAYSELYIPKRN